MKIFFQNLLILFAAGVSQGAVERTVLRSVSLTSSNQGVKKYPISSIQLQLEGNSPKSPSITVNKVPKEIKRFDATTTQRTSTVVVDLTEEQRKEEDEVAYYYEEEVLETTSTTPSAGTYQTMNVSRIYLFSNETTTEKPSLHSGHIAPFFVSPDADAVPVRYYSHAGELISAEQELYRKLLGPTSGYLKNIRPTKKYTEVVEVEIGISVMMIEELVERDQLMIMSAAIKMKWLDRFLSWNPMQFDELTWIAVSSTEIWIPDISIVNSPNPFELTRKITTVDVDYMGEVGYFPSGNLITRCNIHIAYFPFDSQHCEVLMESWIYPTDFLRFVPYEDGNAVDIKEYYTNHQWALTGYDVRYENASYDNKNFSQITFTFVLKRKSQYYFMYFIFPQLLLACLQTFSHTLPVEHPGRMTMLTSLFIGTSVTQAGVANSIPKSSDAQSLLQIYMTLMSINLVIGLIISTVILYVVLRFPNEPPSLLAIFVALFSIVWPPPLDANDDDDKENLYHVNDEPEDDDRRPISDDEGIADAITNRMVPSSSMGTDCSNDTSSTREQMYCVNTPTPNIARNHQIPRKVAVLNIRRQSRCLASHGGVHVAPTSVYRHSSTTLPNSVFAESCNTPVIEEEEEQEEQSRKQRARNKKQRHRDDHPLPPNYKDRNELKKDWLLYCVALDKTIMYVAAAWNVILPIVLFAILPALGSEEIIIMEH